MKPSNLFPLFVVSACLPLAHSQTTPSVLYVASGMAGTTTTTIAPGSIISIGGTNLATVSVSSTLVSNVLPTEIGSVQVTIGGIPAPLFMVSATMIEAEVPLEVPAGATTVVVTANSVASAAFSVTVATTAPTVLSDSAGALILKASDYSRVGPANPLRAGEIAILYVTGLGVTSPVQVTGTASSSTLAGTAPVAVTVGGAATTVYYSLASPGYVGLDQIAFEATADIQGAVPVVLTEGSVASVAVNTFGAVGRAPALDPQVQAVYNAYLGLNPIPIQNLTPAEARLQPTPADAVMALLSSEGKSTAPVPVGSVVDTMVPGGAGMIPARIYTPAGTGPFPVVVYFHGGGFVIATIDTYDASARAITNDANAIVLSVEYRKAPENRFPAAPQDAYAATQWAFANAASFNGDPTRVAVAGESAGGNLATVVCMMARDMGGKMPLYQALIYPLSDYASQWVSYTENAAAPFLTLPAVVYYGNQYLNTPSDALNPYASPLVGNITGLPPATVISSGYDPLRDQVAAYATKLSDAGIVVDYTNYDAESHEFFGMGAVVDAATMANQQVGNDLKAAFTAAVPATN